MTGERITIGVVPRERFSVAPESLRTLLQNTPEPYELIVVDPGMPEPWRSEVADLVASRPGSTLLTARPDDRPLLPNSARNLVLEHPTGDWLCFVENDVLVGEHWLGPLIEAAKTFGAGAAVPLILERFGPHEKVHFDDRLDRIVETRTPEGVVRQILPRGDSKERDRGAERRVVQFIETHCMLFRREAIEAVGGFDGSTTAQEEVGISLALHVSGATAVFEPASVVTFLPPPPVYPSEREYYRAKWDPATYADDHIRMCERWAIVGLPSAIGVVETRRRLADEDVDSQIREELALRDRLRATADALSPLIERGRLVLIHDNQLDLSLVCPEADVVLFLERDGVWWGPPPDSATAIAELERMREGGASTLAVAWPSFWWLDHYADFERHLRQRFEVVAESEQVTAFDLRAAPASEAGPG